MLVFLCNHFGRKYLSIFGGGNNQNQNHQNNNHKMSMNYDFRDKVVLITGSSSGIGAGIAEHFSSLGANVVITGRNEKRLREVGEKCRQRTIVDGQKVLEIVCDMSNEDDLKNLITKTIETFDKLNVLVNNAGIYQIVSILKENLEDYIKAYDNLFQTNVRSLLYVTKLAIPYLEKTGGNIVNVSSVASHKPAANNTLYAMSKSAIDMFTKSMALELAPKHIRCNAINPAAIRTPIFNKIPNSDLDTDRMARIAALSYPVGRIGEPSDCANAVAYLASDQASFINGVCLLVDGGSVNSPLIMPDDK